MLEIPLHPLPPNETHSLTFREPPSPQRIKRDVMCPDQKSEVLVPKNGEVFLIRWGGGGGGKFNFLIRWGGGGGGVRKQGKIIFDHDRSIFCWISRKVAFFWVNILGRFFAIVMMKCSLFSPLSALCGCVRIFSFLFSPRALWLCPNIPFSLWLCSNIPPACGTAPGSNARKKMGDRGACWFVRFLLLRRQKRACAFAVATTKGCVRQVKPSGGVIVFCWKANKQLGP